MNQPAPHRIVFANEKGGTGKSTSAVHVAIALAYRGARVAAIDLDLTQPRAEAIHGVATVREADGLALSSRNRYLSPENRTRAAILPRAMREAVGDIEEGTSVGNALSALEAALTGGGFDSVDYAELADADSLGPLARLSDRPARLLVAARIGGTRLIDNMAVGAQKA